MAISRPPDSAPVNRRGGRGRGRGSSGPRASLKDEEGHVFPQLAQYVGGRGAKGEEQEESAEPKRFPDIPLERYPPKPDTMGSPHASSPPPDSHGGERNGEQKSLPRYPAPTEKQLFMRDALTSQLTFYRQSDYYIDHEDLTRDGGVGFQAKKEGKIRPGMYPAYYPEEITKQERLRKRRMQPVSGRAVGTRQAAGLDANKRESGSLRQAAKDAVAVVEETVWATLERKEAQVNQQGQDFEEDDDHENEEEYEDGAPEFSDGEVNMYEVFDDDDDGQDDDEENQTQGAYY